MTGLIERVRGERGNVGVLMALFLMVAVGSLMMTWNTVQLSKEKMRLQAAADSAALSACVCQARGMNAVQNINDDMYMLLSYASKLKTVATPLQRAANSLWSMRRCGIIFGAICAGIATVAYSFAMVLGGTAYWMVNVCSFMLRPLAHFYVKSSALIGFWDAQHLAGQNGAKELHSYVYGNDNDKFVVHALGVTEPIEHLFKLPLVRKEILEKPWISIGSGLFDPKLTKEEIRTKLANAPDYFEETEGEPVDSDGPKETEVDDGFERDQTKIWSGFGVVGWAKRIHKVLRTGSNWQFYPYVSTTDKANGDKTDKIMPKPVLFVVRRDADRIETAEMDWWDKTFGSRPAAKTPMIAVAAAQCITGDVIPHSKPWNGEVTNYRPAGFGAGATARLIPVSEYAELTGTGEKLKGGIFH